MWRPIWIFHSRKIYWIFQIHDLQGKYYFKFPIIKWLIIALIFWLPLSVTLEILSENHKSVGLGIPWDINSMWYGYVKLYMNHFTNKKQIFILKKYKIKTIMSVPRVRSKKG